jgi:hypothetical protein
MLRSNNSTKLTKRSFLGAIFTLFASVVFTSQAFAWYGVHLETYPSQEKAAAGWEEFKRVFPDILADAPHRLLRVETQEKGALYRIVAGPFTTFEEAMVFNDRFLGAGRFTRVVAIDDSNAPLASATPKVALSSSPAKMRVEPAPEPGVSRMSKGPVLRQPSSGSAVPPAAKTPQTAQTKASNTTQNLTAPTKPNANAAGKASPAPQKESKSAPVTNAKTDAKTASKPETKTNGKNAVPPKAKQETAHVVKTEKKPGAMTSIITEIAPEDLDDTATDAKADPKRVAQQQAAEAARAKNQNVKPLVGNLPSEFGQKPRVAPSATTQEIQNFLPYVGLGITF